MWSSTVGLVNGKHRYLTAETFGFKINSNGQVMKKRQQWTIEPFPENLGPDGSISSAASVSSQYIGQQQQLIQQQQPLDPNDPCILTFSSGQVGSSLTSIKSSSNGSNASDQEACGEEHENVAIKSHLNKYLAVDSFGNVTCDSDEKTETARFTITICSMSQGRSKDENIFWAFRNVERGYYLGATEDGMICCDAKMPKSRAELWHLHLIPARGASFFSLKSLGRKRFARITDDEVGRFETNEHINHSSHIGRAKQVQLDATISWGSETLFQFKYYDGGKYSLLTGDTNKYLTNEGKCISWKGADESALPPAECLFTLEYHSGFLAFRDSFSHYLAAAGRSSILRSRSIGVSRDELFVFESAPIQVSFKATFNNRWVSIKQTVDLSANQTEPPNKFETFQLTFHKQTQNWSIMTYDCNFWTVSQNTSTISTCKPGDYEGSTRGQFKLVWARTDETCSLKYVDANRQERWVSARKSGQLFLSNGTQTPIKFIMRFQNRRLLNLRPVDGSGFVGLKSSANCKQLEANKTAPDTIAIEYLELSNATNDDKIINGVSLRSRPDLVKADTVESVSKPIDVTEDQQTINMFNVKLNSTKLGQSVLDRFGQSSKVESIRNSVPKSPQKGVVLNQSSQFKQIDSGIDDNNNCLPNEELENRADNGSVECTSTPSVASIINSFSNIKVSSANNSSSDQVRNVTSKHQQQDNRVSSSILRLANSLDSSNSGSPQQQPSESASDTASVIMSCSTASGSSTVLSGGSSGTTAIIDQLSTPNSNNSQINKQVTGPIECCYLKTITNDRYLAVGENDSSVICDATNKAFAQQWILELRSHSSIAIRASDKQAYMQLGTNGTICLSRCDPKDASLWEF